jgi:hypothetical protein
MEGEISLSLCSFVCLSFVSVCLPVCLFCLFVLLYFVCLLCVFCLLGSGPVSLSVCLLIYSVCFSVCLFGSGPVALSVCLLIHCVCFSVRLFGFVFLLSSLIMRIKTEQVCMCVVCIAWVRECGLC